MTGTDNANSWTIASNNAGDIASTGTVFFLSIQNLTGGSSTDDFVLDGGTLAGAIDGGTGVLTFATAPDFEANAQAVLAHWRARGGRIIHVRHASLEQNSPLRAEEPGFAFFEWAEPLEDEVEIVKHVNSCFIGTGLEDLLHAEGHHGLVLLGLTTNHCVSTTARMAGNLGFDVCLVGDACATFPRTAS